MSFKYFNVKNGLTTGNITLHSANANVQANYFLGNISVTNSANLGNVSNVKITGGTGGYVLQTDGTGNLSWVAQSGGGGGGASISNGNSSVNIPTANGNINLTANGNTSFIVTELGANLSGNLLATGNINAQYFTGNGYYLTGVDTSPANISNGISNVEVVFNGNVTTSVNGNANILTVTGTGIVVTGNAIIGTGTGGNLSGVNIVTANLIDGLTVNSAGNVNAQYFVGNGYYLTGVDTSPANISNGISNVEVAFNGNVSTSVNGNANILVVTGTGINVTGNATIGTGTGGNLTGANIVTANLIDALTVNSAGNVNAQYFVGNGFYLTGVDTSPSNITNGTSNVEVAVNGNVTTSVAGNANILTVTGTGINVTGNAIIGAGTGGNISGANIVTANLIDGLTVNSAGNVNAQYFVGNGFYLTGVDTSPSNITNGTSNVEVAVNGNVTTSVAGNANILTVTGTGINVTGNAIIGAGTGGNISGANIITSNTFTALTSVNFVAASNVSLGAVANVKITGGTSSYVLSTDGTGNLSWVSPGSGSSGISNGNSNVNIPTANGNVNITAVGNTTAVITGTGANILGYANVTGNVISSANVITDNILGRTGALTITSAGTNTNINLKPNGVGNIDANSTNITNVKDPTNLQDAATKAYVDSVAQGLDPKESVQLATTTTLPAYTYNNGTLGVNANITATATGALSIDSTAVANLDRVLIKNETSTNAPYNGIYVVTNAGNATAAFILTRSTDFDIGTEMPGAFVFVEYGTTNPDTGWVCTTNSPVTVGTTNITFVQFSGAGTYTAGTGLTLTGTQFSISNTSVTTGSYGNGDIVATFTVNQQGQLTAAGNTSITANAANLTGTTLNASIVTSSLTSVGTLGNLTSTGVVNFTGASNVSLGTVGNVKIIGGSGSQYLQTDGTGNLTWASISTSSTLANGNSNVNIPTANGNVNISAVGNANVVVVTGTGINVAGTLNVTGNATVGNLITSGSGGNITNVNVVIANTFIGSFANGNSNISIPAANGNINLTAVGNTTAVITGTGVNVAGTLNATGNANVGNLGFGTGVITGTGNITAGSFIGALANGNSNVNIPSANGNVNITAVGNTTAVITGTGVNVFGTLNVTGNITAANASLGNLATANFFTGNASGLSSLTFGNITTFATAGLTTDELYLQAITRLNVTTSGASGYLFDQYGATLNPALYVNSGQTLAFNLNVSGHPFLIQTSAGANYSVGLEYVDTTGIVSTTTAAQGQIAGTLYWKIPYGITGNYKYQCSIHGGMNGNIVITDANIANIAVGTANSVAGANVTGNVANANFAGFVTGNAQGNITSVGSLTGLTVSNATGVVDFANTSNVTLGVVSNLHISGGTGGYVLQTDGAGNLSWTAQSGGGTAATIANGTSNVNIATAGGNVTTSVNGNANILVVTGTGANISGTLQVSGQSNLGNVGNVRIIGGSNNQYLQTDGTGNLTWATVSSSSTLGNGNSEVSIPTANGNINLTAVGNTTAIVTGTGVNVSGTLNTTGNVLFTGANVSLGNVGNVRITGGTANYVLKTDGTGNLSWTAQSGGGGGTFFQTYTASSSPPGTPAVGDQWYNTTTQVLYEYANVGTGNFWLDIQSPVTASAVYTTYVNRSYTADGVVKAYTVTLGCGVNDVLVFLNGICQMPTTDYTVSGTTLTLDALPAAGVIIQIREMPR